jgi:histidyl-tRNA synthetase
LTRKLKANDLASKGIMELENITTWLEGFPKVLEKMRFDLNLARGLSYYTGPIFEVVPQGVKVGSISGGGRYDELTSVFGVNGIPGVGFSFGIDRVYDLLNELGKTEGMPSSSSEVLIVLFDEHQIPYYLKLLENLRLAGVSCELYPEAAKLKKQFAYADAKKIPWVLVAGEDEIQSGMLTLKNLSESTQETLGFEQVIEKIKS